MAPSEHPQTPPLNVEAPATTGIQTPPDSGAPAGTSSIPLSPLPRPPAMDPAKFLRLRGWLDALLVALVLLFAFLVALFPVVNSDFFRQLATGRLILQGGYQFGVDPFVYTADDGAYVVNHSWLFALLMYGLYQLPAIGGVAVVIFKAVLIAVLAEVLLRTGRRAGQSLWIPAACTALAVLTLSSRLPLQSTLLSFLFLAVTLWLLPASRARWLLPPLFALWVNCDSWFFLGPLTIALYLLGELLQRWLSSPEREPDAPVQGELRSLGLVFVVGLAACLLNPHHVRAFTLPMEFGFSAADDLIENDPQFRLSFLSPLWKEYYDPHIGLSVAGLAYWVLLGLGAASFVPAFGRASWGRLLVWLGFALLSLYNIRGIAFFAIVAGPIMALNWLDYAAGRLGSTPALTRGWRYWSLGGRVLTVLAALALLIATVPGWLQAQPHEYRRLGWHVHIDPSLQTMAQTIHEWRQAGRLDEPHWFNMQHEVANYLAWFAPGERVFLDHSLQHFRKAAEDYLTIRQGLEQLVGELSNVDDDAIVLKKNWRKVLRDRRVHYWIFDNISMNKPDRIAQLMLLGNPDEWILCHLKGRIAIFAWRDPPSAEGSIAAKVPALDLKRVAFGPKAETAPPRGPEPVAPRAWWEAWWQPAPPLSMDRDTVVLYDSRFQFLEEPRRRRQLYFDARAWQGGVAAGAIAASLPHGPLPNSLLPLSWCYTYHDLFPPEAMQPARPRDEAELLPMRALESFVNGRPVEPPSSLYLAIRAARRALLANPEDAATYFRLGQEYQRLGYQPLENNLRASAPQLAAIRRTQMAAAFQSSLRLPSDLDAMTLAQAHGTLYDLYAQPQFGYLDAAVHHLREALDKWTAAPPPPDRSATQYNQQLERMSTELTRLDAKLRGQLDSYELRSASKSGLEKVQIALELGLTDTALAALEDAAQENVGVFSQNEQAIVKRMTSVALDLGRLDKARVLLPDAEDTSGKEIRLEDLELYVRLAAARGDYEEADRLLAEALRRLGQPSSSQTAILDPVRLTAESVGQVLLTEMLPLSRTPRIITPQSRMPYEYWLLSSAYWVRRWRMEAIVTALIVGQQRGDWYLTRGWLALESGHCEKAKRHFQAARDIAVSSDQWIVEIDKLNAWRDSKLEIPMLQQLGLRHRVIHNLSVSYLSWWEEPRR